MRRIGTMADVFLVYEDLEHEGLWLLGVYANREAALEHRRLVEEQRYHGAFPPEPIRVFRAEVREAVGESAVVVDNAFGRAVAKNCEQELIDG